MVSKWTIMVPLWLLWEPKWYLQVGMPACRLEAGGP
jgi:hypothetical protein